MNNQKLLTVALIGEPNAGKSTLVNALVGEKVSIVSPKVQTTRKNVCGIVNVDNTQLIFIDTPGLFKPKRLLEKSIVSNAFIGIEEADTLCVIIDVKKGLSPFISSIIQKIKGGGRKFTLILNKIDLINKNSLLETIQTLNELEPEKILIVSALKNDGVSDIIDFLVTKATDHQWIYGEEQYTDQSLRTISEETTREQAFLLLNEEIPYSLKIETERWEELDNGGLKLYQAIVILKESQKSIVVGKGGSKIKEIGKRARSKLEHIMNRKVHLFLHVKIREDWIERDHA